MEILNGGPISTPEEDNLELKFFTTNDSTIIQSRVYDKTTGKEIFNRKGFIRVCNTLPYNSQPENYS